jgi:hypothetical protein
LILLTSLRTLLTPILMFFGCEHRSLQGCASYRLLGRP